MLYLIISISIINISFWVLVFSKLSRHKIIKKKNENNNLISDSSLIISIKNESENILNNFTSFINQKPQGYEFCVIDDYSTDNSLDILQNKYPNSNIKILKNSSTPGKKHAISNAIRNSTKEYIILTDADCYVKSDTWFTKMLSKFDTKTNIVLGYSPYEGKSFLHRFIRFETFMTALQYFSYQIMGLPYMGVGRNMGIKKSFFIEQNGYLNHIDIKSGNDDLFINENANSENTKIQIDPETFVYSIPPENLKAFIKQKTRHISTSFRYKTIHKLMLGIYSFSHIGYYLFLIISLFILPFDLVFSIWALRIIIIGFSTYKAFKKLKETDLFIYLPILDFLMFVYYTFIGIYYFFAPKNKW